jgi:acetamidase/formamidase
VTPSATRHVCDSSLHNVWDGTLTPACEVESGDSIELAVPDASYGQLGRETQSGRLLGLDFSRMNPVAGPVFIRGARAGDTLEVEILEVRQMCGDGLEIVPGFDCWPTTSATVAADLGHRR